MSRQDELFYVSRLREAVSRYRTALWSVSGPEAAHLCQKLDAEFKDILHLIDGPKTTPKPLKDKTHGK
jgi:hypothetical protein